MTKYLIENTGAAEHEVVSKSGSSHALQPGQNVVLELDEGVHANLKHATGLRVTARDAEVNVAKAKAQDPKQVKVRASRKPPKPAVNTKPNR